MRDYLEPMLGTTGAMIAQFAITLVGLALVILLVFWLIRTFTGDRVGSSGPRGRQPRLSVLDALPIDQKRRLVLVRRDNVEHLILIGGPSDLVVEAAIHRAPPGQRRSEGASRPNNQPQRPPAPPLAESRVEPAYADVEPVLAEPEPPVAEPRRAEPVLQEPARPDYARPSYARPEQAEPAEPMSRSLETQRIIEAQRPDEAPLPAETAADEATGEPEAVFVPPPPVVAPPAPPRALTPKPLRAATSFLGQVGRSRTAAEPSAGAEEPRRPEPPARPLGRSTPVAPKVLDVRAPDVRGPEVKATESNAPEPLAAEPEETVLEVEEIVAERVRVEPPRFEPMRAEPVRSAPRAPMPPAPPVTPPSMGDAPYGAPNTDPDAPPRFEPIFDIDPDDVRDPGRPTRPAREPSFAAPSIAPPRPFEQDASGDAGSEPELRAETQDRTASVGDLEKEMARLLGEISGTRRS